MAREKHAVELTIAGAQVQVTHETVPIGSLRLNPDNPRIRFLLMQKGGKKDNAKA